MIYWPGMTAEIQQQVTEVSQCGVCHEYLQKRKPLMIYDIPTRPWQMVGQDLFRLDGRNYLIMMDYFSDYWEDDALSSTSNTIVECTKVQFA